MSLYLTKKLSLWLTFFAIFWPFFPKCVHKPFRVTIRRWEALRWLGYIIFWETQMFVLAHEGQPVCLPVRACVFFTWFGTPFLCVLYQSATSWRTHRRHVVVLSAIRSYQGNSRFYSALFVRISISKRGFTNPQYRTWHNEWEFDRSWAWKKQ